MISTQKQIDQLNKKFQESIVHWTNYSLETMQRKNFLLPTNLLPSVAETVHD